MENTGRKSRQKAEKVTSLRAADAGTREYWLTELNKCAKLTLNTDV